MTPNPKRKLEGDVKAELLDALKPLIKLKRIKVLRLQSGTRSGGRMRLCEPGTPDLLVLIPNGKLFIELKRPGGRVRETQTRWAADAERLGHRVWLCDNVEAAMHLVISNLPRSTERAGKAP